jgi:hypothetical protein
VALIPVGVGAKDGYAIVDAYDSWVDMFKWTNSNGYAAALVGGQTMGMHRLILGDPVGVLVDHRDEDRRNNRRFNIRHADKSGNMSNRGLQHNNTSGYKGVWFHKQVGKWTAEIKKDGKKHYLGLYESADDAARAYNSAAILIHGEFAQLNLVPR